MLMSTVLAGVLLLVGILIISLLVNLLLKPKTWTLGQIVCLFGGACIWVGYIHLLVKS